MNEDYLNYWGKANQDDNNEFHWHPVAYHSLDVAAVAMHILQHDKLIRKRLSTLSRIREDVLLQWIPFIVALHDVGKFSRGFQFCVPPLGTKLHGAAPPINGKFRHDSVGYSFFKRYLIPHGVTEGWFPAIGSVQADDATSVIRFLDPWIRASTGHHGQPPDCVKINSRDFTDQNTTAVFKFAQTCASLFKLPPLTSKSRLEEDEYSLEASSWLLSGLVVLSDWVGSN